MRSRAAILVVAGLVGCAAPEDWTSPWAGVVSSTATASAADERVIFKRLASQDPLEVVWGAYLAGELGVSSAKEQLHGLLQDESLLRDTALDALAQLGASVSGPRLREALDAGADYMTAMAVALQEPRAHRDVIFDAFSEALYALPGDDDLVWLDRDRLAAWRGYANALTWLRDPEFAALLLRSLSVTVTVVVVSPGEELEHLGTGGAVFSHSCCGGWTGFSAIPPRGAWAFADAERKGDGCLILLPGPRDVCLARRQARPEPALYEQALQETPLRAWVTSVGHADALELVDGGYEALATDTDSDALQAELESEADVAASADEEMVQDDATDPVRGAPCVTTIDVAPDLVQVDTSARNGELKHYLGALLAESTVPELEEALYVGHYWRDEATFLATIAAARGQITEHYRVLASTLRDAYLLPEDARVRDIPIDFQVIDQRTCGVVRSLPQIRR